MAQDALTIKIKPSARYSSDMGVTELIRRVPVVRKSASVTYTDTTAVNLFELPENVLVLKADVRVTTAFDASGTSAAATATITMPNDTGTETLFDSAETLLQSTGFKPSTAIGITPSSGGLVILNYTPGTTTAGALEVYLTYVEYSDEL